MKRTAILLIASMFAAGAMTGVAAAADPYTDRPQIVVRVADLNLENTADQAEMVTRVEQAARRMCRDEPIRSERRKCAAEAVAYTLTLVPAEVRHAYNDASGRRETLAMAGN